MQKEFVEYELALRLKELGFDEPCIAYATLEYSDVVHCGIGFKIHKESDLPTKPFGVPTWQSAFRWLIPLVDEEYKVCFEIDGWYIYNLENEVYEGIKSLEKLIEIVESKSE